VGGEFYGDNKSSSLEQSPQSKDTGEMDEKRKKSHREILIEKFFFHESKFATFETDEKK
jgi:hypothetical protein